MKNLKTTWNLGLLYKNEKDPQIEKDLKTIEKVCADFEKKYKKADFTSTPEKLLKALEEREEMYEKINGCKPHWYFSLKTSLNSDDSFAGAESTKFNQRITHALNKVTFFGLKIAKIPKSDQKKFLKNSLLKPYSYDLKRIFDSAQYDLSEGEEQMIGLLWETSYSMWKDGQKRILNKQLISHGGKEIPVSEAVSIYADLPKKERRELYNKITETLKSVSDFADAEINAVFNFKKVLDERRGYKRPYSSTVLGNENDEKNIELLVSLVTRYFPISKRFFKIHAKLLGENKITMADTNAKIGDIKKKFDFPASVGVVREAFNEVNPKYAHMLDMYLEEGHIDVYPRKGKSGGAFCTCTGSNPTYILLNHTDDVRSVETLAHEMGHGVHYELSKHQPPRYQDFSISTAEVASTFFEQVVGSALEKHLSESEKIIFLHNKIKNDIATIFRQVAGFNFELELHETIRAKGQVPKGDIADMLSKHLKSHLGEAVEVQHDDGYLFVRWSHIRNFFYVYTYAYGQLVSRALFENWKKDKSYAQKIEQFLSSGRSMSPEDIFKKIGIDTSDKTFFESGLKSIENDIKRLEKMAKK